MNKTNFRNIVSSMKIVNCLSTPLETLSLWFDCAHHPELQSNGLKGKLKIHPAPLFFGAVGILKKYLSEHRRLTSPSIVIHKSGAGFTLLELLTVISVLSFIANSAFAIVITTREKARFAGARSYAQSVHQSFGATEDTRWTFNNGDASDESGNGHPGTPVGSPSYTSANDTNNLIGRALSLDGGARYVFYDIPDWSGSFTVTAWANSADGFPQPNGASVFSSGNPGTILGLFQIDIDQDVSVAPAVYNLSTGLNPDGICPNGYFRLLARHSSTQQFYLCFGQDTQKWHFLAVSFKKVSATDATISIYMDGKLKGSVRLSPPNGYPDPLGALAFGNQVTPNNNFLAYRVGVNRGTNTYFNGLIDEVNIYREAISTAQIEKLYAEGLPRHKLAEQYRGDM